MTAKHHAAGVESATLGAPRDPLYGRKVALYSDQYAQMVQAEYDRGRADAMNPPKGASTLFGSK